MIPMILFIIIAFLGGFHVISVETTAWGFAVWFVIMIARAGMLRMDENAVQRPDILVPPQGKRRIPGGLGSDVPAQGQSNSALLALMKLIEVQCSRDEEAPHALQTMAMVKAGIIEKRVTGPYQGTSDYSYDEPMACYPEVMPHE